MRPDPPLEMTPPGAVMAGKPRRMAGKHKRARTVPRLADLIVAAKGALSEAERTEFRRLCALLDVEPEQVWERLGLYCGNPKTGVRMRAQETMHCPQIPGDDR